MRVDYVELVDWATLEPVEPAAPGSLFAVAAWVGATRLIDNAIPPEGLVPDALERKIDRRVTGPRIRNTRPNSIALIVSGSLVIGSIASQILRAAFLMRRYASKAPGSWFAVAGLVQLLRGDSGGLGLRAGRWRRKLGKCMGPNRSDRRGSLDRATWLLERWSTAGGAMGAAWLYDDRSIGPHSCMIPELM